MTDYESGDQHELQHLTKVTQKLLPHIFGVKGKGLNFLGKKIVGLDCSWSNMVASSLNLSPSVMFFDQR